jgi:hypothetical protein
MKRTTVMLDESTYAQLQAIARRQGKPAALLIREAVARYVAEAAEAGESPLTPLIGCFDGPERPLGEEAEAILATILDEKYPPQRHDPDC